MCNTLGQINGFDEKQQSEVVFYICTMETDWTMVVCNAITNGIVACSHYYQQNYYFIYIFNVFLKTQKNTYWQDVVFRLCISRAEV